jgi:hypothetical protein
MLLLTDVSGLSPNTTGSFGLPSITRLFSNGRISGYLFSPLKLPWKLLNSLSYFCLWQLIRVRTLYSSAGSREFKARLN